MWLADAAAGRFLDAIIDNIPVAIFVKDARDLRFLLVNKAAEEQMGCNRRDMVGRTNEELLPAAEAAAYTDIDLEVLRSGEMHVGDQNFDTDKGRRLLHTRTILVREAGEPRYLIGLSEDITDRRANEARIVHLAHHDALTDLPNRLVLLDRLAEALVVQRRHGGAVGVLCIDLDHFKDVNDGLGHAAGDSVLKEVARRLRDCVRGQDLISRHGGDEFTVLQPLLDSAEEARRLAERIIATLSDPFRLHEQDVVIGASVGISVAPQDGVSAEMLLRHADMALYRAKADGRGAARFFEAEMDARVQARRKLERDLRAAFALGELELHYQPLLVASDPRITGFEALLRWRHSERGFISPAEFIPVAEEIGLIAPITEWVLAKACAEAANWPSGVRIAVNLSPAHFRKQNPAFAVAQALAESGLAPDRLEVEITESVLLSDSAANIAMLHQIRALGVRIVMDDFGTGYSSLSYLRSFPFDKIKIDRSFVTELGESPQCAAIVRAVTSLGASLGITTTAEGVETTEQWERLRAEGCQELQGFLFSRPVPPEQARLLLSTPFSAALRQRRA
ncbi:EAL domain-containing protein [Chelatococcus sambhunathii]|uniref:EAL domain-containing protein n=2 Tax=Chelatococcus sambhunathii TaxID=363953 RepID=A0ABU1DI57_9HYPH|nr:EAL domain-containing protein [Chelatococcus sambhunathii]